MTGPRGRKSIRLPHYDYASAGAYFVTISTYRQTPLFGRVEKEVVLLGDLGQIAHNCWNAIPTHFSNVSLDEFIVMSNHMHGILLINEDSKTKVGAQHAAPLRQDRLQVKRGSLGAIVRSYKAAVTKLIREKLSKPDFVVWQRNYYERVIRSEQELEQTRFYIHHNAVERD